MSLFVFGINHHTAPIAIREKCAFNEMQLSAALHDLVQNNIAKEAVILSTCNRTEFYTSTSNFLELSTWLCAQKSLGDFNLNDYCYEHHNDDAVKHLMRVASGLDSMILGEPQVLGQIKNAYQMAQNAGTVGAYLNQVFPAVFEASKFIRTNTGIGANAVSIAYVIAQLSKTIFDDLSQARVLLIGAGETIELIATHFRGLAIQKIIVANRTLSKTQSLVETLKVHAIQMQDIPAHIKESDIVISATASQLPILGKGMIENALKYRENKPLLLIDLAVPRDIEPEIASLPNVHLYNIDDLQKIIADNLKNRRSASIEAEKIIELQTADFLRKMRVFNARHVIAEYRERLENIRLCESGKALQQLKKGVDAQIVLEQFGQSLVNKILHHPTVKLREAASEEECEMFLRMKTFFELE